jgi:dipeptide transport system permease protein
MSQASLPQAAPPDTSAPPTQLAELWRDFRRNRGAIIGLAVVVALLLCALLADVIAP